MSWIKKRTPGSANPSPAPQVQMYNPNQHSTQENQWYSQQVQDNWYNQPNPAQSTQPTPQQNYPNQGYLNQTPAYNQNISSQHYGQQQQPLYQQQQQQQPNYYQNDGGYTQHQQESYGNLQYSQQYNQNNTYRVAHQHQPQQQTAPQGESADAWNWAWGDKDNSNVQAQSTPTQADNSTMSQANPLGESFATDDAWNWGMDDTKQSTSTTHSLPKDDLTDSQNAFSGPVQVPKLPLNVNPLKYGAGQEPSLLSGKRGKLDTPQWSTESQMSQESSDLQTSESDKSHMSHSPMAPTQFVEDISVKQDLGQFENKEIVHPVKQELPTQPPMNLLPSSSGDDSKNPYKRATGLSHKAASKFRSTNLTPPDSRQNFAFQQVNLETLPDNSEQPDPVPILQSATKVKPVSQWMDNNEAPINDRNQYLETGHLSELASNDFDNSSRQDTSDAMPPVGLRRMIPGQIERNENQGSNLSSFADEPPPGLSRMVLGQPETVSDSQLGTSSQNDIRTYDASGPPEGLHRMVPGESSSPESTMQYVQQGRDDNDSEAEFTGLGQHTPQPRSATIGADTPPAVANPSLLQPPSTSTRSKELESSNRRTSIEGQNREADISNLATSVRNLTVGENLTDAHTSNNSLAEAPPRRHSRQESSESERELKSSSRGQRDRRSADKAKREKERERDKNRDSRERYSPDTYHDKKYDRRRHKDRRYEEDTDYYSDKEKEMRSKDRDREYERRYGSLRKDKDKDRRRRDPRDPRDYRRNDYYYGSRYDEDYDNEGRSSRPSSRSDSVHDSYRERVLEKDHRDRRHRDRDRERYRRQQRDPREMYNPYQALSYDPYNPYYQQYQYYENLRRTNPQAYAEWYRKYYQQATGQTSSYGGEDRASVHSGRSSANDELAKDRYTRQSFYSQSSLHHGGYYAADVSSHSISGPYGLDTSSYTRPFDQTDSSLNFEDSNVNAQRLTPVKFATAHIKGNICSGKLLKILPHYPMDGQNATVEICQLHSLLGNDAEFLELNEFPGPLTKGVTHKKTIIEYCENKIRSAGYQNINDVESYVLMWELLILLIRQNGMVVGTDIAELLLKNRQEVVPRPSSVLSSISSNVGDANPMSEASNNPLSENIGSTNSVHKEEEVTNKFREYLLYGSGKEALEYAMKHGLWGHALFLASKLDKRTYANVMMRFANGLTLNDPLQTLYQLLSGKIPAAVTCVSDEKWGDWRPHLAMILSNSSQRPELNCKAITTLGDTLNYRGSLYAAQFCYLLAEVGFGKHDDPDTRLVLLGADHRKPFPSFVTNEAIHMTEIYEYACGLNVPNFTIPHFEAYKYLLATRLADRGLLEKALNYLEKVSEVIIANPSVTDQHFVDNICRLADRLKFYDPVGDVGEDESQYGTQLETSRPDHSWLKDLRSIQNDFQNGLIAQQNVQEYQNYTQTTLNADITQQTYDTSGMDAWQSQQSWQSELQNQQMQPVQTIPLMEQNDYSEVQYVDNQNYWSDQTQLQQQQQTTTDNLNQYNEESAEHKSPNYYDNAQSETHSIPQITMPGQNKSLYDEEPRTENVPPKKEPSPVKAKPQNIAQEKTQSTGWFGGIFSKLALKPKNQMKLPEDKNPKIVWDQEKKRWVNVDEDPNDPANEFKPPPKMSEMMPKMASPPPSQLISDNSNTFSQPYVPVDQPSSLPVANNMLSDTNGNALQSSHPNMFKLQKSRNLKNSYIDVFNRTGGGGAAKPSLPTNLAAPTAQAPQMNFFIPQPITDPNAPVDFLTPGGVPHMGEQQMSRWSSTSSLSREVQYYMQNQNAHRR